ncbi:MAG: sensor histidine kinase, partial [Euryarchaeota archaeon]|nr:sensor histidine kinase [Euryarchaeota archaeon]
FMNLFGNAVKYGRGEGEAPAHVRVTSRPMPQTGRPVWWVIDVDDDGPGIPEGYEERIFRPFERAPDRPGREQSGTGVGLAIARKVARHYGGDLIAMNRPEGGARFRLTLPYSLVIEPPRRL